MSQEDIDAERRARIERADELRREEAEEAAGEFNTIYVANEMFPEALYPGGYTEYRELPNIVKAAAEFRLEMILKFLARLDRVNKARKDNGLAPLRYPKS